MFNKPRYKIKWARALFIICSFSALRSIHSMIAEEKAKNKQKERNKKQLIWHHKNIYFVVFSFLVELALKRTRLTWTMWAHKHFQILQLKQSWIKNRKKNYAILIFCCCCAFLFIQWNSFSSVSCCFVYFVCLQKRKEK